ncbi:MAG: hypothetical protein RR942_05865 [Romboutsia sp.]
MNINKKNEMKSNINCKNCGCSDVVVSNVTPGLLLIGSIICFLIASGIIWIPVLGLIIALFFIIGAIVCFIGCILTILGMKYTLYCKGCNKKYKISKREYIKLNKKSI